MQHELSLAAADLHLVPLAAEHAPALLPLVDDALWAGMTTTVPRTDAEYLRVIDAALASPGTYAFAVLGPDGAPRGSTSFYDVVPAQQRCEIGHGGGRAARAPGRRRRLPWGHRLLLGPRRGVAARA